MFRRALGHIRRQPVAFIALFLALGGSAVAGTGFLTKSSKITKGDLAGSTYGNPVIAPGKVTNPKLANPSLMITAGTGLTGVARLRSVALGI
jgi:predicted permease